MIMNKIYRKELSDLNTNFLLRIKHNILDKAENDKELSRNHTHMLVDVLSELEYRRTHNRACKFN